jgi:hypothetical protein
MANYRTLFAPGAFVPFSASVLLANASSKKPYFPTKADHNRPAASLSLYNHTQSQVIITLDPGITTYLPNLFLQDKYNDAQAWISDEQLFCIAQPMDATKPVLRSIPSKRQQ